MHGEGYLVCNKLMPSTLTFWASSRALSHCSKLACKHNSSLVSWHVGFVCSNISGDATAGTYIRSRSVAVQYVVLGVYLYGLAKQLKCLIKLALLEGCIPLGLQC